MALPQALVILINTLQPLHSLSTTLAWGFRKPHCGRSGTGRLHQGLEVASALLSPVADLDFYGHGPHKNLLGQTQRTTQQWLDRISEAGGKGFFVIFHVLAQSSEVGVSSQMTYWHPNICLRASFLRFTASAGYGGFCGECPGGP